MEASRRVDFFTDSILTLDLFLFRVSDRRPFVLISDRDLSSIMRLVSC